ncbi:MAG: hypothetical protein OHK0038_17500 [Flammeovirgaceae bacterium]
MREYLIIFFYGIFLLVGSYLIFFLSIRWWKENKQEQKIQNGWQLVPKKAGLVLEIQNLTLFKKHLDTLIFWEELQNIADIEKFERKIELFSKLSNILPQKDTEPILLISSPISLKEWGAVLIFPIQKTEDFLLDKVFENYKKHLSLSKDEDSYSVEISDKREFLHQTLFEWNIRELDTKLTLCLLEDYLITSFSSQTLEEIIRHNYQKIHQKEFRKCDVRKELNFQQVVLHIQPSECIDWFKKNDAFQKVDNVLIDKYKSLPILSFRLSLSQNILIGEKYCEHHLDNQFFHEELKNTWKFEKDWRTIIRFLPETWKNHILNETSVWKNFQEISWNLSNQNTDFQIIYNSIAASTLPKIRLLKEQWWTKKIQEMKIFPTALHTLLLIQDEEGIHAITPYSLLNAKPLVLWNIPSTDSLEKWINIVKIQNNFWASSTKKLYKISDKGKLDTHFSLQFPDSFAIEYFQAFQSIQKELYFLGIDSLGKALMINEKGKVFEGWNQRSLLRKPNQTPEYLRVGKKEGILSISEDGWVNFLQLNGKSFEGFPMLLNEYLTENNIIENGNSLENTIITLLTKKGELLKINLKGQLVERKKPYQPKGDANFVLLKEENKGKAWLMVCQDDTEIIIFGGDSANKIIFQEHFEIFAPSKIQFFQMDENNTFYVIRDEISEETYIYKQGEGKIGIQNLKNSSPVWMINDRNKQRFLLITAYNHHLRMWNVPNR